MFTESAMRPEETVIKKDGAARVPSMERRGTHAGAPRRACIFPGGHRPVYIHIQVQYNMQKAPYSMGKIQRVYD